MPVLDLLNEGMQKAKIKWKKLMMKKVLRTK
jgi:hypothetical protein